MRKCDKQYVDLLFNSVKSEIIAVLDEREKASAATAASLDKQVIETARNLEKQVDLSRSAYDSAHNTVVKDVGELKISQANAAGKASQSSVYISYAISAVLLLLEVLRWIQTVK